MIDVAGFTHEGFDVHDWDKEKIIIEEYASSKMINKLWR